MRFLFKIESNKLSLLWSNISLFTQISLVGLSTFLHSSELFVLHKHFSARLRQRQLWILFLFALSTLTYHRIVNSSQTDGVMLNWKQIKPGMHLRQRLLKPPPTTVNRSTPAVGRFCHNRDAVLAMAYNPLMLGCSDAVVVPLHFARLLLALSGHVDGRISSENPFIALLIATCMRLPARGQGSCGVRGMDATASKLLHIPAGFCNNVATTYV